MRTPPSTVLASTGMSIWFPTASVEWIAPGARRTSKTWILKTWILKQLSAICWKPVQNPIHVIGFNVSEGWIRDVSEEIAQKLRQRRTYERRELPYSLHELVEQAAKV
jgi:hypothetical protein